MESKKNSEASCSFFCYFCKKPGHIKMNHMKYKEMLKRKDDKDSDRASVSRKSDQAGVVKQADENLCDILTAESGKSKYSDAWLLDSECTYHVPKKRVVQYLQVL